MSLNSKQMLTALRVLVIVGILMHWGLAYLINKYSHQASVFLILCSMFLFFVLVGLKIEGRD